MGRIAGTYLTDECKVEKYAGRSNGMPSWEDLGTTNCRDLDRANWSFTGVGNSQNYDAQIIMYSRNIWLEKNVRYRLTVTENKSVLEKTDPDGPPEVKRTRVLEASSFDAYKDAAGTDWLQVVRCVNGHEDG